MRYSAAVWLMSLLLAPRGAWAHAAGGDPAWTFDPWVVLPLLVSGGLYIGGTAVLWRRVGIGRGIRLWQAACYGSGWLALSAALVTPLHWFGERLFTAHMVEHEIVMAVAAPLLALSRPVGAFLWALPRSVRRTLGQAANLAPVRAGWASMTSPLPATLCHGAVIWVWHAPRLFELAVAHVSIHRLQHLTFLASALAFWWALVRRSDRGSAIVHLFATMVHTTILGALIVVAPRVLYLRQTAGALRFGLTPLQDQQLAGLVMWVPAGTVYAGAALAFAAFWVHRSGVAWKDEHALPLR